MKIESRPRRSGKTTELIEWLKDPDTDEDRVLITMSTQEREYAVRHHGLPRSQVVFVEEVEQRLRGRRPKIRIEEGAHLIWAALERARIALPWVDKIYVISDDSIEG